MGLSRSVNRGGFIFYGNKNGEVEETENARKEIRKERVK
jgi:hypothetical protein